MGSTMLRRLLVPLDSASAKSECAHFVPKATYRVTCNRSKSLRLLVGLKGFEPSTFRPPAGRATKLRHSPL